MIDNFLRPASTPALWCADIVRGLATIAVVACLVILGIYEAGVMAFTLPGLFLPRFVGVRGSVDLCYQLILVLAAVSNIFGLYAAIGWWDLFVHFVCAGAVAAMAYLFLVRLNIVFHPRSPHFTTAGGLVIVTMLGLGLGAAWEMVEWIGFTFITNEVEVSYDDTISDMLAGGLGAVVAGWILRKMRLLEPEYLRPE